MNQENGEIKYEISDKLLIDDIVAVLVDELSGAIVRREFGIVGSTAETIAKIMKEIGGEE